jgi:hypothetical protein
MRKVLVQLNAKLRDALSLQTKTPA